MQTAENLLIPRLLQSGGISPAQSLAQYGMLGGMVLPVLLFPAALPASLGTLLLPEIARRHAQGHVQGVQRLTKRTLHATLLLSTVCCATFLLCGENLMQLLYRSPAAGGQLCLLAPLLPLTCADALCDALLKGLGKQTATMLIETLDGIMRIAGLFLLLPRLGMMGYVLILYLSAALCCAARIVLLCKAVGLTPMSKKTPRTSLCRA